MGTGVAPMDSMFLPQPVKKPPTSSFGNPATFTAAANTQASDYDNIMKEYADIINNQNNKITPSTVTASTVAPQTYSYTQSPDVTRSLSDLSGLADNGGYSESDIADMRARGISPIRSIYANAQQNVERQRALSGGYSPNFNAVQAKMARDESSQIGDAVTNVNAQIAQNRASNRLSAAPNYASAAAGANAARTAADANNANIVNQINTANAASINRANEVNANNTMEAQKTNLGTKTAAIEGQKSLYGTTPALTNTFGNQVVQAAQLSQGQQQINDNRFRNGLSMSLGTM